MLGCHGFTRHLIFQYPILQKKKKMIHQRSFAMQISVLLNSKIQGLLILELQFGIQNKH